MKKLGLSLAIAATLGLTACGGGSGGSGSSTSAGGSVSGTASKGIVIGGLVSAYLFDSSGVPETTAIATATTNAQGDYSLSVPAEHLGKPLFIVVDDNGGSATMKCDIAGGCDADGNPATTDDITPFGGTFALGSGGLTMSAVLPQASSSVSVNVTPLTTVAAELARSEIGAGASDQRIAIAIATANSQISTTFGLGADITQIPVVDLTDATEVAAAAPDNASNKALNYAAINAAIVSAVQSDAAGTSPVDIGTAITSYASNVVASGGVITNAVTDTNTSLAEILAQAVAVIDTVEAQVSDAIDEAALDGDLADAQSATPSDTGALEEPNATDPLLANLAKVKDFVEELRELGVAIDASIVNEGEASEDTVLNILNGFDAQVDAAQTLTSSDNEAVIQGLSEAMAAIVEVYEANVEQIGVDQIAAGNYTSLEGVAVTVTVNGAVTLSVDQAIDVEVDGQTLSADVDISAVLTDLTLDEAITDAPGEVFTASNAPGTYLQSGTTTIVLNAGGSGTYTDGDGFSSSISWMAVDGALEITWQDGDEGGVDRYELDYGNIYDGGFTVSYDAGDDGTVDDVFFESLVREGYDGVETTNGTISGAIDFNVDGTVAAGGVNLSVTNGTVQANMSGTIDESWTWTDDAYGDQNDNSWSLSGFLIDLDATLAQTTSESVSDPISFTGGIEVSLSSLNIDEFTNFDEDYSQDFTEEDTFTLSNMGVFGLVLDGAVSNTTGESFDLRIALELDGSGVPAYTSDYMASYIGGIYEDSETRTGGETESSFVDVGLNIRFDAALAGVSDALTLEFDVQRTAYDDASATLDISYPGRDIVIAADIAGIDGNDGNDDASGSMTITNVNDGIVITVTGDESIANEEEELSVAMRMDTNGDNVVNEDDFLYGWYEVRNGVELLVFADDRDEDNITFESLF